VGGDPSPHTCPKNQLVILLAQRYYDSDGAASTQLAGCKTASGRCPHHHPAVPANHLTYPLNTPRRLSLHLLLLLLLQSRTGNRQAQNLLSIGMKRIAPGCTAALATLRLTIADASQHARRRAGRSCFPLLCVQAPQASVTSAQQNEPAARCHISAECRWAAIHTGDLCAPPAAHPLAHTPPPAPPRKKIAF